MSALSLRELRGRVETGPPSRLVVTGGVLRLSAAGLAAALAPGAPWARLELRRMAPGRLACRVLAAPLQPVVEVRPFAAPSGALGLELLTVRAGPIPLPGVLAGALIFAFGGLDARPELRLTGDATLELDLAVLLRQRGVPLELPPLNRVVVEAEWIELRF